MTDRSRPAPAAIVVLAALAVLEAGWLVWFLSTPLPNAANVGGQLNRANLLWISLPGLIPGVSWSESHLGAAVETLSHVENLPDRLPILLAAALIAGAAVALGELALRRLGLRAAFPALARLALAYGLGASGLGVLTLVAGRLGMLAPWPVRLGLGALIAAELLCRVRCARRASSAEDTRRAGMAQPMGVGWRGISIGAFALVAGPFLILMLLGAMLPTIEFDALEYHLQGPKEYYQAGRITFLPHNVYTSMPFGVEMLHLLGMEVLDDWWAGALAGQVLVMLYAPATAVLIALVACRLGSPRAGWVAAAAYLTTPWVYRLAITPFVEGPLCYYHAAPLSVVAGSWSLVHGKRAGGGHPGAETPPQSTPRSPLPAPYWLLCGLLAGGAMACKYPALISAVIPFGLLAGLVATRGRRWGIVAAYVAGAALVAGPWLVKNVLDTGNPVYPLAGSVFGDDRDPDLRQRWVSAHATRPLTLDTFVAGVLDVAGRSDWQSPLFVALAPLSLLRRGSRRVVPILWVYALYLFLTWWALTHRVDRFWMPILVPLAVLAGLGADWLGGRGRGGAALLVAVLGVGIVSNLVLVSTELSGSTRWTDPLKALRVEVPAMVDPPLAALDAMLPPGARVLLVGQASVFPMEHEIVYNTVFDPEMIETLARGRTPVEVGRAFAERKITHVYVDWGEIARYRQPGNYGYSEFVTPALFSRLVASGVLEPLPPLGPQQELYRVREGSTTSAPARSGRHG